MRGTYHEEPKQFQGICLVKRVLPCSHPCRTTLPTHPNYSPIQSTRQVNNNAPARRALRGCRCCWWSLGAGFSGLVPAPAPEYRRAQGVEGADPQAPHKAWPQQPRQPLLELVRRLIGERDGQDVAGLHAAAQQVRHARSHNARLAATGAYKTVVQGRIGRRQKAANLGGGAASLIRSARSHHVGPKRG